jgi:hypothetical protein
MQHTKYNAMPARIGSILPVSRKRFGARSPVVRSEGSSKLAYLFISLTPFLANFRFADNPLRMGPG